MFDPNDRRPSRLDLGVSFVVLFDGEVIAGPERIPFVQDEFERESGGGYFTSMHVLIYPPPDGEGGGRLYDLSATSSVALIELEALCCLTRQVSQLDTANIVLALFIDVNHIGNFKIMHVIDTINPWRV
jgi:hypothetical protein